MHFELMSAYGVRCGSILSFLQVYLMVPAPFFEDFFFHQMPLHLCQKPADRTSASCCAGLDTAPASRPCASPLRADVPTCRRTTAPCAPPSRAVRLAHVSRHSPARPKLLSATPGSLYFYVVLSVCRFLKLFRWDFAWDCSESMLQSGETGI